MLIGLSAKPGCYPSHSRLARPHLPIASPTIPAPFTTSVNVGPVAGMHRTSLPLQSTSQTYFTLRVAQLRDVRVGRLGLSMGLRGARIHPCQGGCATVAQLGDPRV